MKSREYTDEQAPTHVAVSPRTRDAIPQWRGIAAIGWTPRMAMAVWGLIHAVIFLGLYKLPVRIAAMTYYEMGSDTQHVYWPAVQKLLAGRVPYVDPHFFVEYPPLGTGFFLLPALLHPASLRVYDWLFAAEVLAVDLATLPLIARLARRQRISATGAITAYGLLVPFLGSLVSQRYDLVPATLTLGAILALLDRRSVVAWVLLLAATLMKLYPAALVPLFLLYDWRPWLAAARHHLDWQDARRRSRGVAVYMAGLVGSTVAWYLLAPASLERFARWETRRGIEIESLFGSVAELGRLGGLAVSRNVAYGSYDVASALTPALKLLSTALTLGLLAAVYLSYARRMPSPPTPLPCAGEGETLTPNPSPARRIPFPLIPWLTGPSAAVDGPARLSLAVGEGETPLHGGRLPSPAHGESRLGCRSGAERDQSAWGGGEGIPDGESDSRALVTHATLAVLAVLLGSKLLSIQFLLWLLPLVAVQAYRPRHVAALAFVIVLLSQWVYPANWLPLWRFEVEPILVLALRNLLLVGLFALLWRHRGAASPVSSSMKGITALKPEGTVS